MRVRFPVVWLGVVALACTLAGCALLDDILPTSASEEENDRSGSQTSPSPSASTSSPDQATPYPTPASGVQVPTIKSPEPGSEVTEAQPTLTVNNASTEAGYAITYTFDLAQDVGGR